MEEKEQDALEMGQKAQETLKEENQAKGWRALGNKRATFKAGMLCWLA